MAGMNDNIMKMPTILNVKELPWLKCFAACGNLSKPFEIGNVRSFSSLAETIPNVQTKGAAISIGDSGK